MSEIQPRDLFSDTFIQETTKLRYERVLDEPKTQCTRCGAELMLSRLPWQSRCLKFKEPWTAMAVYLYHIQVVGLVPKLPWRQGTASDYAEGKYHVVTSSGTFQVAQEHLSLVSSKPAVKPLEWPKWTSLSCQRFLQTLFCYPDYTMPENNGDLSATCVDFLPVTAKTNLSADQQLWLGWQALRWAMQKKGLGLPEDELSVNMVDPEASATYMLRQHPEDQREVRLQAILDSTKPLLSAAPSIRLRSLDLAGRSLEAL